MKKKLSQLQADSAVDSAFGHTDWHTAFVQALQMEFHEYHDVLEFVAEHKLNEEPLRVDCVVIRKAQNVQIMKNIGAFFKEWNLFEYKSPGDYVSVADFYKVYSYACLYVSIYEVPITSLTLSFVERRYPRKLIRHLQSVRGYTIAETNEGIYTVSGDIIPMQIIDSRKLSADENLWLKSLSNKLNSLEIAHLSEEIARQKKVAQIAAYLNVITEANAETLQEAIKMRRALTVEQVFENVGWTAKWEARGRAEGEARGEAKEKLEIARKMKKAGRPFCEISEFTGLPPETIEKL
jgi:hypothetical protein